MPVTPTDPLYASQWHFPLIGDIETVWEEYSGLGVHVGIYDDGIDIAHPDLAANYDPSRHVLDNLGAAIVPTPGAPGDGHGTAVAGLIAAAQGNGQGGSGVAHQASITGVNIFDSGTYGYINAADSTPFYHVVSQAADLFDIMSNSWGSTPSYSDTYQNLNNPTSFAAELETEYEALAADGRGGLGVIINQAAGNDTRDANGSGTNASRFTNTIAASDSSGDLTYYSNFGGAILVTAPAGAVTTDRLGSDGYDPGDYTTGFGGTSAATPIVSGLTALMLEAAPGLGWRDVQDILAVSAAYTGTMDGSGTYEHDPWTTNAATVNGGGQHISGDYGYGMIDAYTSVRNAEVWGLFGAAETSANEMIVTSNTVSLGGVRLGDADGTSEVFTLEVTEDLEIDTVMLQLEFSSTYPGDLRITLTSPDGTTTVTKYESGGAGTLSMDTWSFAEEHLRGESALGTWTIEVADVYSGDYAYLYDAQLVIYGSEASDDDVHHYNGEFAAMLAADAGRGTLTDLAGTDWINLAPVAGNIVLNLGTGGSGGAVVAGTAWFDIAAGTVIENAVTGDGNDTITGNGSGNALHGMRGGDVISGYGGNDTLDGGLGADLLDGGDGADSLLGGAGSDTLNGGGGADTILGGIGADTLRGEDGADSLLGGDSGDLLYGGNQGDTLRGENGADTLLGGAGNDLLIGGGNTDSILGGDNNDTIQGNLGNDTLDGGSGSDSITGGDGRDLITGGTGNDTLIGNKADDTIDGGGGADSLLGGDGNDSLTGQNGADTIRGGNGDDYIEGNDLGDLIEGNGGADTLLGGTGADTIDGGSEADLIQGDDDGDRIWGGAGNDTLYGNAGADTIDGGAGDDRLYGGTDADTFVFDGGFGSDRIYGFTPGSDVIEMHGHVQGDLTLTTSASNTLIEIAGSTDTIFLPGTVLTDFSDFVFV